MAATSLRSWQPVRCEPSRIRLGTSISSVFVRTAPTIAMAASSVADLSRGRFILGLGSSHKVQVEPEHGVDYGKPLSRTRETVAIVRALIRDGRVRFDGETIRIENFDLWYTPLHRDVPVYLAAVFARGVALAGEVADGVYSDPQHARYGGHCSPATQRRRGPGRTRPKRHRDHDTAADSRRRYAGSGPCDIATGRCALCRVLPALQSFNGRTWVRFGGCRNRCSLGAW
jgi:alkanesulfonate monooxygenase SsuD/methylene tetrahydromethanopterin reductase-like flavin-dependent oxidoreductase (luciferase family)